MNNWLAVCCKKAIAAPMAGVSNRVFRDICRARGAAVAYGEMVSVSALHYDNRRTLELLDIALEEQPRVVQLSGSRVDYMEEAAVQVAALGADSIDLNMGCPVSKVVRNGEGAAVRCEPKVAPERVRAACRGGVPGSVKFRMGWDDSSVNAVEFAQRMEEAGAAWIAIHGRTRMQMYQGKADWQIIVAVKQAVSLPVLGNGDVTDGCSAVLMRKQTGCDGVMVGRGMLGNPWLFGDIARALQGMPAVPKPSPTEIIAQALSHLERQCQRSQYWACFRAGDDNPEIRAEGELAAVRAMRNQLNWYVKGLHNAAALRCAINQMATEKAVRELFAAYEKREYPGGCAE
ncbi:MAG: tRNA-dihydrouridine synthase [Clostridiales bacterium]